MSLLDWGGKAVPPPPPPLLCCFSYRLSTDGAVSLAQRGAVLRLAGCPAWEGPEPLSCFGPQAVSVHQKPKKGCPPIPPTATATHDHHPPIHPPFEGDTSAATAASLVVGGGGGGKPVRAVRTNDSPWKVEGVGMQPIVSGRR